MWKWIFCLLIVNSGLAQTINYDNELLWEISGNGLKSKSYLFGSLHSNDKRLFRLSDSTYFAMDKAEAFVLETDLFSLFEDWDTRREDVKVYFDNKGNPYTGTNKASRTIYGSEDGMPQFLDAYFQEYCYNTGKKFFPLESVEDQLDLISNWNGPEFNGVSYNSMNNTQEKMIDYYVKGDIYTLDRMMQTNLSLFPGMYEDLIVKRNEIMLRGIDSIIKKQATFIAVGAGHLSGEKGLINLLRKKGYKLRKVTASYSDVEPKEKQEVRSRKNYAYVNDTVGFVANFPGKPLESVIYENHPFLIYREYGQGNTYSIEIIPIDEELSLRDQAAIYIASPDESRFKNIILDDGTEIYEGISDTYPEGMHWIRLVQNDKYLLILKAYGGNKFMNSNRPRNFFSKVWLE